MATSYASYTRGTTEFFKSLVHRDRLASACRILGAGPDDLVLDYGCGDGHLLALMQGRIADDRLFGFDPDMELLAQREPSLARVDLRSDIGSLIHERGGQFTKIACFEVCEHLSDNALTALLSNIKALAAPGARVVFGVPIEIGPAALTKNLYRVAHGGRQRATVSKAVRSFLGLPIERAFKNDSWTHSHIGFDHRRFRRQLENAGFRVERTTYLPLPAAGVVNNEIYFVCRP